MRGWFDSLIARTIVVLLVGIGAVHLVSLWTYQHALDREAILADETRLADRLLTIRRAVMRVAPSEREAVAHDLSGGPIDSHWSRAEHAVAGGPGATAMVGIGQRLRSLGEDLADGDVVIGANRAAVDDPHLASISLRLPDRSWINFSLVAHPLRESAGRGALLSTTLMALGAIVLSIVLVRWLTHPLSTFVDAAKRLYRGTETVLVPEDGPTEIRALARAFNEMQRRIKRLVDDRTQALAAVSHDLKTPITRLRFRIEDVGEADTRDAIAGDLDEMERMIDQTLAYLRGDRADEPVKPVDIVAILETLAGDLADVGHDVELRGSRSAVVPGRHLALKRAFANLVENAVKYGERAVVEVAESDDGVEVLITDEGPGIPPDRVEMALQPFVRLEPSRNADTGGFGLGLTIAKAIVEGHGGELSISNRLPRGLAVRVRLLATNATPGS